MAEPHYTPTGNPRPTIKSSSQLLRQEFDLVEAGIEELFVFPVIKHFDNINSGGFRFMFMPFAGRIIGVGLVLEDIQDAARNFGVQVRGEQLPWAVNQSNPIETANGMLAGENVWVLVRVGEANNVGTLNNEKVSANEQITIDTSGSASITLPATFTVWLRRTDA